MFRRSSLVTSFRRLVLGGCCPLAVEPRPTLAPSPVALSVVDEQLRYGSGDPKGNRGHRKPLTWARRRPWFTRRWTLYDLTPRKGPPTPTFPDGVPFKRVHGFQEFAGFGFEPNTGLKRKVYMSTKRGRKLGLSRYQLVKKK